MPRFQNELIFDIPNFHMNNTYLCEERLQIDDIWFGVYTDVHTKQARIYEYVNLKFSAFYEVDNNYTEEIKQQLLAWKEELILKYV